MTDRTALASFEDLAPDDDDFLAEVLTGLADEPKHLPCKFFYDEQGSKLFERICGLPEYYLTRTETGLLRASAPEIAALVGPDCQLVELGAGSGEKARIVLDALERPAAFVGVDISRDFLVEAMAALAADLPHLAVHAVCADFTKPFRVPAVEGTSDAKRVVFFPGSTLGNFTPDRAVRFLAMAAEVAGPGGAMLIGIDLKKDARILDAAYNDAQGVTAAFNKNLLARVNRELGGTFALDAFRHHAFYDAAEGRIEMHLVSLKDQVVRVAGTEFRFREGETIHTENSYKYSVPEFQDMARAAGFVPVQVWTDENDLFSIHYLASGAGT